MNYEWPLIINQNTSFDKYERYCADCQVVTAANAYYVLTGENFIQDSDEYRDLCELAGAVAGSAICIGKVYDLLKLTIGEKTNSLFDYDYDFSGLGTDYVLEVQIWYKRYGNHSVAIIDYEPHCRAFRVPNLKWLTTEDGWIFYEDFDQIVKPMNGWAIRKIKRIQN